MSSSTRMRAAIASALTAAVVAAPAALAAPANTDVVRTVRQPDGSTLQLKLWGDEFGHGYETLDGTSVLYDRRDRRYEVAVRARDGSLRPGGRAAKAKGDQGPKKLRPTRDAVRREREEEAAGGAAGVSIMATTGAPAWAGADTDVLFLAVEFSDVGCSYTAAQHQAAMFGGAATGPGDLDDYYREISYGALELDGRVVGTQDGTDCIALAGTRDDYNTQIADGDDELVKEAIAAADPYVDFADYDNDGDGTIDALGIIYAGGGPHDGCSLDAGAEGSGGDRLWPHSGGVNGGTTADGKTISPFIINSELTYAVADQVCDEQQSIGLFAHELGHSLGLPDLYDTDEGNGGVHVWSAMASQYLSTTVLSDTPGHFDPWSKAVMGWITPQQRDTATVLEESLPAVSGSPTALQFRDNPDGFEVSPGSGEYFLVENRQLTGFDQRLPGCGILVWHIDESVGNNNAAAPRKTDVLQADGLEELNVNGGADAGDPFPGTTSNNRLAEDTTPDSRLFGGADSGLRMAVADGCAASKPVAFGPNQPPVADAGGPYTTDEGTDVTLDGSGSSDPDGDAITHGWEWTGNMSYDESSAVQPGYTAVGDDDSRAVGLRVTDPYDQTDVDATTLEVQNVAPAVTGLAQTGPVAEGHEVAVSALVRDPGWLDDLTATVDWGDGAGPQGVGGSLENARPDATLPVQATHTYGDDGAYTVTVCGRDDDGGEACDQVVVTVTNTAPQAEIDLAGTTSVNGVDTVLAEAGASVPFAAALTDPGSDDLQATWSWDDGTPATLTTHLLTPPGADPDPSPSVDPRDVGSETSHVFADACVYDVTVQAADDDGGTSPADAVRVLVAGTDDQGHQSGWWAHQHRGNGHTERTKEQLDCYLEITSAVSDVFNEVRDASTRARAAKLLFSSGAPVSQRDQLDRDLLTAWMNFADGAVGWAEAVDTDGAGGADTPFHEALEDAEAVRLDPASTPAEVVAARTVVNRINSQV